MKLNFEQIKKILPHRYPILMIDKVLECVPGEYLLAAKAISGSDPVLQGHYPNLAIFPGVYLVETMAQAASLLAQSSSKELELDLSEHSTPLLASLDRVRFRSPVLPGSLLHIEVRFKSRRLRSLRFDASIKCGDTRVCDGVLSCVLVKLDDIIET
ncbi:MAG: 3-hydroxyacyl-ACP dehydratase FabZ [Gammaproteobacteria bacterium]|nr:3-hydroxyacyl-ACP dehydratase FabZ [Pseudomonadota bacterium]MCH9663151.1 3-hydroxyacyl-ACP dehydratase FabZ [Gammaproteobacteria bacterium]